MKIKAWTLSTPQAPATSACIVPQRTTCDTTIATCRAPHVETALSQMESAVAIRCAWFVPEGCIDCWARLLQPNSRLAMYARPTQLMQRASAAVPKECSKSVPSLLSVSKSFATQVPKNGSTPRIK
eukprot:5443015-Prymnesium_polylepis.2